MEKPLREYARKRDFKKTREPGPKIAPPRKSRLRYVIQEHHASHLHYDFRLEWEGVLKSWAVPKGPSEEPGDKRLAVEVEDHPLSYATFTGRIPEGEYGAGEVFRWDIGTWEPVGDAAEGLRRGRLDFVLHGKRLQGRWLLVRTARKTGKPQWLLIKKHDEKAETPPPKTRGRRKEPRGRSTGTRSPMPDFIQPQLAQLVPEPPESDGWLHELKFDGYRLQIHARRKNVRIFTRNGNDWTVRFPVLVKELANWNAECILDGEAVVLDENGRSDFQRMQNMLDLGGNEEIIFYAFDLLYLGGRDLRELPLTERKSQLEKLLRSKKAAHVLYSRHFDADADEFLESSCKLRLEGMVSKRADAPYSAGRGATWVKAKCARRQELVIGGFTKPQGARSHFGALLVGYYDKGVLRYAGKVGTGYSRDTLKTLHAKLAPLETGESPFGHGEPRAKGVHWVKPKLVAEIAFSEWTADGILRAPVFQGLREDKPARSVQHERAEPVEALPESEREADPLHGLTHPEKVIFRKPKLTKRDLAAYYLEVAPLLLPHAANRPLSLLRCPEGETAECFFQKHFREGAPPDVRSHRRGTGNFLTIDSPSGLVSLVQLGALELHAQNGRAGAPDRPDQIVIDFDPGPGVSWAKVRQAAFDLKVILDELGLESFVKTSGGKGLHVHVPIEPVYPENDVKDFARALAEAMVARHPARYVSVMSKQARPGKIFVDYLRNGKGSTAVVPYGVRARPGAPVAMPIEWKEVRTVKAANVYSVPKAIDKIRRRRRDPWTGYLKVKQRLPLLKENKKAA